MTKVLNKDNFDETIKTGLVLLDFWAEWCGPCQQMLPILDDFSKDMEGKMIVAKLNVDEAPDIAQRYRVMSIPTLLLFKDGELIEPPMIGVQTKENLENICKKHL